MRLDQDKYLSNSRKRFITIAGTLWGIVTALSLNTGSLTNAVDFTIPTTFSLNEATLNMPGNITVASSCTLQTSSGTINISGDGNWSNSGIFSPGNGTVKFDGTNHGVNGDSTFYNLTCITANRSEEHTSELQSQSNLGSLLLLVKKKYISTGGRSGIVAKWNAAFYLQRTLK